MLKDLSLQVDGMKGYMQALGGPSHLLSHRGFNHPLLNPKIEAARNIIPSSNWNFGQIATWAAVGFALVLP